eukprot:jgi/Botrbrau1/10022/Bobra.0012s0109.1
MLWVMLMPLGSICSCSWACMKGPEGERTGNAPSYPRGSPFSTHWVDQFPPCGLSPSLPSLSTYVSPALSLCAVLCSPY